MVHMGSIQDVVPYDVQVLQLLPLPNGMHDDAKDVLLRNVPMRLQ